MQAPLVLAQQYLACSAIMARLKWMAERGQSHFNSEFHRTGILVGTIPDPVASALRGFYDDAIAKIFSLDDVAPDYVGTPAIQHVADKINAESKFFDINRSPQAPVLEEFLREMQRRFEDELGGYWRVSNVRAWKIRQGARHGANAWHTDGLSRYERKIMMYLDPPGRGNGTLDIRTKDGRVVELKSEKPTFVLADTGYLSHCAVPPSVAGCERPAIEVTLIPAMQTSTRLVFSGLNARFPVPDDAALSEILGAYLDSGATFEEIEPLCKAALAMNPAHREAKLVLGALRMRRGEVVDAQALFEQVLAENPGDLSARYGAASASLSRQDDLKRALFVLVPTVPRKIEYVANGIRRKISAMIGSRPSSFQR
jgi:tetratricopeptide (TPR) repeat protein